MFRKCTRIVQVDSGSGSDSESRRRSPRPLPEGCDLRAEADYRRWLQYSRNNGIVTWRRCSSSCCFRKCSLEMKIEAGFMTQWPDSRRSLRKLVLHSLLLTWHSDTFLGHWGVFTAVHLGSNGSWSRAGKEMSSRLNLWPTQPPVQWEPAAVIRSHWPELESDSHFHFASKFILFGTVVFPTPSCVFMAWILI